MGLDVENRPTFLVGFKFWIINSIQIFKTLDSLMEDAEALEMDVGLTQEGDEVLQFAAAHQTCKFCLN